MKQHITEILLAAAVLWLLAYGIVARAEEPVQRKNSPAKPILLMTPSDLFSDPQLRALAVAAQHGNVKKVDALIAQGVNVNGKGRFGIEPLFSAWQARNKKGFKALLDHGANPNVIETGGYTLLNEIAQSEDPHFMKLALAHGANPNLVEPRSGETPIFVAAANPYGKANVPLLIKAGADLNHQGKNGETPLMGAAGSNQYDVVYSLLEHGADYRLKDKWGKTVAWDITNSEKNMDKSGSAGAWLNKVVRLLAEKGFLTSDRK